MLNQENSAYSPFFLIPINDREELLEARVYLLNKKRTIYLNSVVNEDSAFSVASAIQFLAEKSSEDIILYINSPGGSVSDGMAIFDAMRGCECDIITVATGMAASMGAFLAAAGTKGKRYATPATKILLHQPLGGAQGQASDIMIAAESISKTKAQLTSYLASFTGQSSEKINSDLDRDLWLNTEEALAYGLIDHIGNYKY